MYIKSREQTIQQLRDFFPGSRYYRTIGEKLSPLEKELLEWIVKLNNNREHLEPSQEKIRRNLIKIARHIGVYPIPDWIEKYEDLYKIWEKQLMDKYDI